MDRIENIWKNLNQGIRTLILIIFSFVLITLVLYISEKTFSFFSDIASAIFYRALELFFYIYFLAAKLVSSIIPQSLQDEVSNHILLIIVLVWIVFAIFSIIRAVDYRYGEQRKIISDLEKRIQKLDEKIKAIEEQK